MANIDKDGYIKTQDANGNIVTVYPYTKAGNVDGLDVFGASGSNHSTGLVPDPGATAGSTKYLREDGTWAEPSGGGGGAVDTVYIGSTEYAPDANGKVTLPNYPTTLPASDVYSWAKASSKPTYTASEVGLGNVGNFKAVSTVASQGLSNTEKSNARTNIGAGTGTVTGVKVGSTSYSPSSGVVSLPAYPTTLPASDVYSWAKASSKPSYTYSEVGAAASSHTHSTATQSSNGFFSATDKSKIDAMAWTLYGDYSTTHNWCEFDFSQIPTGTYLLCISALKSQSEMYSPSLYILSKLLTSSYKLVAIATNTNTTISSHNLSNNTLELDFDGQAFHYVSITKIY